MDNEDIKILEEFIEAYKIAEEVLDGDVIYALENLIARNKELDYKNAHEYRRACKERDKYWELKVKEKIKELKKEKKAPITIQWEMEDMIEAKIQVLQELLD